jgi:hypothetical protein
VDDLTTEQTRILKDLLAEVLAPKPSPEVPPKFTIEYRDGRFWRADRVEVAASDLESLMKGGYLAWREGPVRLTPFGRAWVEIIEQEEEEQEP